MWHQPEWLTISSALTLKPRAGCQAGNLTSQNSRETARCLTHSMSEKKRSREVYLSISIFELCRRTRQRGLPAAGHVLRTSSKSALQCLKQVLNLLLQPSSAVSLSKDVRRAFWRLQKYAKANTEALPHGREQIGVVQSAGHRFREAVKTVFR